MNSPIDGLLSTLRLTDTGAHERGTSSPGPSQWMPLGRVFGGQVLAQSITAATHTIAGRPHHPLDAGYFLRPGDVQHPITFSVDRIHDGRSFSARRTQAFQHGEPILSLIASFQTHDEVRAPAGDAQRPARPRSRLHRRRAGSPRARRRALLVERARVRRSAHPVAGVPEGRRRADARQAVWMRARPSAGFPTTRASTGPRSRTRATTRSSNRSCAHGIAWATPGLKVASLDRHVVAPATPASTTGCCTRWSRRRRAGAADSRWGGSTPRGHARGERGPGGHGPRSRARGVRRTGAPWLGDRRAIPRDAVVVSQNGTSAAPSAAGRGGTRWTTPVT